MPPQFSTLSLHDALPILLHAPAVLAKQHPRLECQHPPQRVHHRVHVFVGAEVAEPGGEIQDRKSTRLNSSHRCISYAVFCLKKKKKITESIAAGTQQA